MTDPPVSITLAQETVAPRETRRESELWSLSKALETNFISVMLTSVGLGQNETSFGGGVGEDQFASFLVSEQAKSIVDSGGFGLAETIYLSLTKTQVGQT